MPKAMKTHVRETTIFWQVEENMDSIAMALNQMANLRRYDEYEKMENEVFAIIQYWAKNAPSPYREIFEMLYDKLLDIDKNQDLITQNLMLDSINIGRINEKSNSRWKFYDIKGPYQLPILEQARYIKSLKGKQLNLFENIIFVENKKILPDHLSMNTEELVIN